ncbi:hypothetical protein N7456_013578 [Penicillium angulare]|uniref:Uncharacterized protein n=1 Tax=Penicillium angulare TaxID=116970 RepID=A0A9W9EFJ5_9EURO|nr:hypothetical protein N7456_013578 [Penicillium angulare]
MSSSKSNRSPDAETRQMFFNVTFGQDITIPRVEWDQAWPSVDHMYSLMGREFDANSGHTIEQYWCRLYGKPSKPALPNRKPDALPRHLTECPCRMKIVHQPSNRIIIISRTSEADHNHGYEDVSWKPFHLVRNPENTDTSEIARRAKSELKLNKMSDDIALQFEMIEEGTSSWAPADQGKALDAFTAALERSAGQLSDRTEIDVQNQKISFD